MMIASKNMKCYSNNHDSIEGKKIPDDAGCKSLGMLLTTKHDYYKTLLSGTQKKFRFFYVKSREISHCPYCEGSFKVIGSRRRVLFQQDGTSHQLVIRRLRCTECHRISHELPDKIIPYKRYESDVISEALREETIFENDFCPAENSTIKRWKLWFFLLHKYIEDVVRAFAEFLGSKYFVRIPLYPLFGQANDWLKLIVRNLINSGRWPGRWQQTHSA